MDRDLRETMNRHRVTFWTGIWEPTKEAISKEVAWLRSELAPRAPVVSFTPQPSRIDIAGRVLEINFQRWLWLRAVAPLEYSGDVTHIFGGIGTTEHFLQLLGRRPILFTVVIPGAPSSPAMYSRVAHFVAQTPRLAKALNQAGVPHHLVGTVYPGVNVEEFCASPAPGAGPFTLLFASTPSESEEIEPRGIGLLIELARTRPDITIRVLWRRWGDVAAAMQVIELKSPPPNFVVIVGDVIDMASEYRAAHATVCCFATGIGKAAPNSVVEGLASARPALVSDTCELAEVVGEWRAGVVTARTVESLARGVDDLQRIYTEACTNARRLAEHEFNNVRTLRRYATIYEALARRT